MTARVQTGLRILCAVADRPDPTTASTVGTIASRLQLSASTVSRVCAELATLGLLERGGVPGAYRIGPTAVELSGRASAPHARAVHYALTLVAQQTGETACLAAGPAEELQIVAAIASSWTLHAPAEVGETVTDTTGAIHRVASGDRAAGAGAAVESVSGSRVEVAVPVLDTTGEVHAVLAVRIPVNRTTASLPRARRALHEARRRIERSLLFDPGAPLAPVAAAQSPTALGAAVLILAALAGRPATVTTLAAATGLRPDRTQRIAESCRRAGLLTVDRDRHFTVAWRVHGWYRAASAPTLRDRGAPLVADTADRLGVCAFITVLRGMRSVTLVEELRDVGGGIAMLPWLGRPVAITESDGGPMLVMDFDDDELASVFPRRHSRAEIESFTRRVRAADRDGVVVHEALEDAGILSIAAPVRDASGTVAATVCIVGPSDVLRPRARELADAARGLAAQASALLDRGGR